ncbi:DUF456 domain-containing protein [Orenia marismortui]|uniref:DUF456 domain-containing protein n=1 Tax=Orenia marismortui TaxID=46469 RepID=A0A4R8GQC1_9FIRM|nr:DUF456 domain-containing protein [Orenia marismortui]TDX48006.1 hypothetical protein C7959_13420 [Orenia marismortui]
MSFKIISVILSSLGVLGTLVPMVPGTPLILLAALIYAIATKFTVIGWGFIISLVLMSLVAEGLDYFASVLGAKYFGASKYGLIGAIIGGILALILLGPIGILIGPLLGSIGIELIMGKNVKEAIKVGIGTIVGKFGGSLLSFVISVIMTTLLLRRIF